jgi:hypothetical protein
MKTLILTVIIFLSAVTSLWAQVPKKIVVEHFTNSVCSVCATRNPGFYTNLANQNEVFHIAVHPSSPYSSCQLNQHNPTENDARTNYYGIYGATPRLVIQGEVISPNANYSAAALFNPYTGQTSPVELNLYQQKFNDDSIRVQVVVKTISSHSLGATSLFVALAEDTLLYAAPNGESQHYDVFRKALTSTQGTNVTIPSTLGDSVVLTFTTPINSIWDENHLFALAILQETSNKEVVQCGATKASDQSIISTVHENKAHDLFYKVFAANGEQNKIYIINSNSTNHHEFLLFDVFGRVIRSTELNQHETILDVNSLPTGVYFYSIQKDSKIEQTGKLVIE